VLLVLAAASLVGTYLAALVMLIPLLAWEVIGYAASLWVLHAATAAAPAKAAYIGLTGLLMLTACIAGSIFMHLKERFKGSEPGAATLMGFFALLYGLVAARLQVGVDTAPMLQLLVFAWWLKIGCMRLLICLFSACHCIGGPSSGLWANCFNFTPAYQTCISCIAAMLPLLRCCRPRCWARWPCDGLCPPSASPSLSSRT
jgi:hypothetical protein